MVWRKGGHTFRSSQGRHRSRRNRKRIHRGHVVHHNHRRYAGVRHATGRARVMLAARRRRSSGVKSGGFRHRHTGPRKHTARRHVVRGLHRKRLTHTARHHHRIVHRKRGLTHRKRVLHRHVHRRHGYHLKHKRHLLHPVHRRKGLRHPHKGWHGHHTIHHPRQKKAATPAQHFQGYELTSYTSMFGG